jgi:hypothetical protein
MAQVFNAEILASSWLLIRFEDRRDISLWVFQMAASQNQQAKEHDSCTFAKKKLFIKVGVAKQALNSCRSNLIRGGVHCV